MNVPHTNCTLNRAHVCVRVGQNYPLIIHLPGRLSLEIEQSPRNGPRKIGRIGCMIEAKVLESIDGDW